MTKCNDCYNERTHKQEGWVLWHGFAVVCYHFVLDNRLEFEEDML